MKLTLEEIGLGLKCFPNFGIAPKLGEIVDVILNDEETIFDEVFFPKISVGNLECVLHNTESLNLLRISHEGPFVTVKTPKYLDESSTVDLANIFQRSVIEPMMKTFKLKRVHQIGISKRYKSSVLKPESIKKFIEKVSFTNANMVDMTFGGVLAPEQMKLSKGLIGYSLTKITKVEQLDILDFTLDVQIRFPDETDSYSDIDFVYLNKCHANIYENVFKGWLKTNFGSDA